MISIQAPKFTAFTRLSRGIFYAFISLIFLSNSLFAQSLSIDFKQWANDNDAWVNGIVQKQNSSYFEGTSTLQRILLTNIRQNAPSIEDGSLPAIDNTYELKLSHKALKGYKHGYDFITGLDQSCVDYSRIVGNNLGIACADPSGGQIGPAGTSAMLSFLYNGPHSALATPPSPSDHITLNGHVVADKVAAYDTWTGGSANRSIQLYGSGQITSAQLIFVGYSGNNARDKDAEYILRWTSTSDSMLILFATHLAVSGDGNSFSYGPNLGAQAVSGASYHVMLYQLNGVSLGSRDNQIKVSDTELDNKCEIGGGADTICSSVATSYASILSNPNSSYAWTITNNTAGATITGSSSDSIVNVNTVNAGSFTLNLVVNSISICSKDISVKSSPDLNLSGDFVLCGDDSAHFCATGGDSYLWSGPNGFSATTSCTGNVTTPGTYSVTVSNAGGCNADTSFYIAPGLSTEMTTITDASCAEASNGSIDLTVLSGSSPFTYNWSNNETSQDISGLTPGTYTVTVTDSLNCINIDSASVGGPTDVLSLSIAKSDSFCVDANSGNLDLTVSGGTIPYTYTWNNGATTEDLTGLSAGIYTVTVEDANGCTDEISDTLILTDVLEISISDTSDASCNGYTDGSIDLSVDSGTPPFNYIWSNGDTTQDLTAVGAGTYSVTVTNAQGCEGMLDGITIGEPDSISIDVSSISAASCNGYTDGSIDLTVTGGTPPFTFIWNNGATTEDLTGVAAGDYTVTVTDANACEAIESDITIGEPDSISIDASSISNASCNGYTDGSIDLTVTGGTPPFTFIWNTGATTEDISGLAAGSYSVTVTDSIACQAIENGITVGEPDSISIDASSISNASCNGYTDGSIDLTVTGGTPPFTFIWNTGATTEDISGLAAGSYSVTVTDSSTCQAIANGITVGEPDSISIDASSISDASCSGYTDGSIDITVTGGTPPFTFIWNTGATTEDLTGVGAGSYSVTVTDSSACQAIANGITVGEPDSISIDASSISDASCNGYTDGSIDLTVTGGTPPFTFIWNTGATTEDLTGVAAGDYTVTVTDANACEAIESDITIGEPDSISIDASSISNASCNGYTDGSIDLTVTGGTPPFTFIWNTGATTEDINGLAAGSYSVTVTDSSACQAIASGITVGEPDSISIDASSISDASCNGYTDGSIDITVTGGTPPFTFIWNTGATTEDISGLAAGSYSVTVTDSSACQAIASGITVGEPDSISIDASSISDASCNGYTDGSIDLTVTGGTPPFTFIWSTGAITEDLTGVGAGSYSVTVTDSNSCQAIESGITVGEPDSISINASSISSASCFGFNDGSIDITVTGGTQPYTYNWNTGASTEDLTGVGAGSYSVTVTDSSGCTAIESGITVGEPDSIAISFLVTDALCERSANGLHRTGEIDATPTGGTAPYTYLWSNNAITEDLTGINHGTYIVTVTDSNGCVAVDSAIVSSPPAMTVSKVMTQPTCNGYSDGTADITVGGGVPPYSYWWTPTGDTTEDRTNMEAGFFMVTATDANGCIKGTAGSLGEPDAITITVNSITNVNCGGSSDGSIDITANGGKPPYTYNWSTGDTTEDLTGVGSGTYAITVTDSSGCTGIDSSITISESDSISINVSSISDASCFGYTDGSIDLTVTGGTTPYTFVWSTGDTTEDISGIGAGSYAVTVTDSIGCTAIDSSITVGEPDSISIDATSISSASCFGYTDGSIDLTVTGGTSPFTFIWSTGDTTEDISGLTAGFYAVTVTDSSGCSAIENGITVGEPDTLIASASATSVTCFGGTNGSVTSSAVGGTTPYTYLWSNGNNNQDISGTAAGTYTVTITDANGCTATAQATVGQPNPLVLGAVATPASCNGTSDGAIDLIINGGTSPYSFTWSTGDTTEDINGLSAGTYSVTVIDANHCDATVTIDVIEPDLMGLGFATTDVTCFGVSDGTIDLSVSGGTTPYTYIWSNGDSIEDLTNLNAGTYTVTVTDANGCSASDSTVINESPDIIITIQHTDVTCVGADDGTVHVSATGGTPPYVYAWTQLGIIDSVLTNLEPGTYLVSVFDANLCTKQGSVTINAADTLLISATATDVSCFGGSDGSVTSSVTGGTSPYTYIWSNGDNTPNITGTTAGTYTVTVIDDNACVAFAQATVNEPPPLVLGANTIPVSCSGASDGAIDLIIGGGTSPYTYLWNIGDTTEDISNLIAGTYSVTVTDANNCNATVSIDVNEPVTMTLNFTSVDVTCFGGSDGSIDLSVSGGTLPYTYNWSNGDLTEDISGLTAGFYTVTVADANGCIVGGGANILNGNNLILDLFATNGLCQGTSSGSIDLTVFGGISPYTYNWSTGDTTEDISGLAQGTYGVTVTDANGCSNSDTASVSVPLALSASTIATDVSCFGGNDGAVDLTVTGGIPPYTYGWFNGATTEDLSGLSAGVYPVIITDNNGCTTAAQATVNQPGPLTLGANTIPVSCNGASDGSIDLIIAGGTSPFTYNWSNGANTQDINNLTAGTYSVTVTDGNACQATVSINVNEPNPIVLTNTVVDVSINGGSDGSIDLSVSGGTAPYTYNWSNFATTEDISNLTAGVYCVTVLDANLCNTTDCIAVNQPGCTNFSAIETVTDISCNGAADGAIQISTSGGVAPLTYAWSNGASSQNISSLSAGQYTVTITDAVNCIVTITGTINEPAPIVLNSVITMPLCNGGSDGSIDLTVTGGTPPYSFSWSNGANTEDVSGLISGIYTVIVTDDRLCLEATNIEVGEPAAISLFFSNTEPTCFGSADGAIDLTVSGGVTPYTYLWSTGATTENISGLTAFNPSYSVTITDANGCTHSGATQLAQPAPLTLGANTTPIPCYGDSTGDIDLLISGGTLPYTYLWSNGETSQDISNLTAGTYSVTVHDGNNCQATVSIQVNQASAISVNAIITNACVGLNDGSIDLTLTGGTSPYTYSWNNGEFSQDINNLAPGIYSVTIVDANSCLYYDDYTVISIVCRLE